MASFWDPKPSPKGQGAQDLLAGVMADGDITPKEGGAEVPALAVKPKVKKEKKDAVAMMKALKEQQNAKKKAEADAAAAEAAAEAERNVDVQDAGPYGDTALGNKGAAVTALVRKQAATAEQPGMNGWKDNLKMVYEEGVITGPDPDAADDVRAENFRALNLCPLRACCSPASISCVGRGCRSTSRGTRTKTRRSSAPLATRSWPAAAPPCRRA